MIELLAITDDPAPPEPPLRIVPAEGLGIVVGPAPHSEIDADALWRREGWIEALMEHRALLPVRYGTVVPDDAAAAAAIAGRGTALAEALGRVRGAVELSVRAVAPTASGDLRDRAAQEGAAAGMHERLGAIAREHVRHDGRGREPLRAAYLVDRDDVGAFVALVRELQREHRGLSVLCTGPWPPYSFAEEAGS